MITRNLLKPKFSYKYAGPYDNLEKQVDYNKSTGKMYKIEIHENPKYKTDEIAMHHDIVRGRLYFLWRKKSLF